MLAFSEYLNFTYSWHVFKEQISVKGLSQLNFAKAYQIYVKLIWLPNLKYVVRRWSAYCNSNQESACTLGWNYLWRGIFIFLFCFLQIHSKEVKVGYNFRPYLFWHHLSNIVSVCTYLLSIYFSGLFFNKFSEKLWFWKNVQKIKRWNEAAHRIYQFIFIMLDQNITSS